MMPPGYAVQPPPRRRGTSGRTMVMVVLTVLVLALVGFLSVRELAGTASAEVSLESVSTPGPNPFMASVGTDQPGVRRVSHAGGSYPGNTPGLFGGTNRRSVCDRGQLSRFLQSHPDKGAGWAGVLGIRTSDIASYVEGLTPVIVRSDTMVTNHGWSDGAVTSYPAVLQAGTAVLVDRYGQIVTKCFCGNPLSAPVSYSSVTYVGPAWASFTVNQVTIVNRTTTITNNWSIVDTTTDNVVVNRPSGTDGDEDETTTTPATFGAPSTGDPTSGGTGDPADLQDVLTARSWTAPASCELPDGTSDAGTASGSGGAPSSPASPASPESEAPSGGASRPPVSSSTAPDTATTSAAPVAASSTVSFAPDSSGSGTSTYAWSADATTFTPGSGPYSVSDVSASSVTLHGAPGGTCTLTPAS